jgi:hypothetical protein
MHYVATAVASALQSMEEDLRVAKVTVTRAKGHTTRTPGEPRSFRGVIAEADIWHQFIAPGGTMSATKPVLVVTDGLLDAEGEALLIEKDDLIDCGDGKWLKVLELADETARYGIRYYTLTEALGPEVSE